MIKYISNSKSSNIVIIIFVVMFFLNSFLGWMFFTFFVFKNAYSKFIISWSIMTIFFISLYNATKVPENDLNWYVNYYLYADKVSFKEYLLMLTSGKEKLYQAIVYLLHKIGGNNANFFTFSISFLSYAFLLRALYIVKQSVLLSNRSFILIIFFLCFFPYTYTISAHIIRQFFATSILLCLLCEYSITKYRYACCLLALSCIFIHSSTIILIPFFFIKKINEPYRIGNIPFYIAIIFCISIISLLGKFILPYFSGSNTLQHIANKMAYGTTFETTLSLSHFLFSLFMVLISIYIIYFGINKLKYIPIISTLLNTAILILCFIIFNESNPEIQLRYNFYFWIYIPFVVVFLIRTYRLSLFYEIIICFILYFSWHFYNLNISEWTYTCSKDYYFNSLLMYF